MLISTYDRFVQDSDQSSKQPHEERVDIAVYGLAAEIGSVVAAVKKRLLAEGGNETWNIANDEIVEELGDVVWYCFSLARLANIDKPVNIFAHDIANLKREIGASDDRAERIRGVLDPTKTEEFLRAAESFPRHTRGMEFEDYQNIAFLTARTKDRTLVEVCLAVLWQLSAQLFRRKLPAIELELNKSLRDKPINDSLGEIAWHVSALASIFNLKLSDIARRNIDKVSYRLDRSHPTPLHDLNYPKSEQFPARFEVVFVTISKGRSRMYINGRQLGNELTDNARDDDGYRFHDVMHLANVAKLGWSPVVRGLMGRKRKSNTETDEVEDGARAQIVEEAVVKAIHSEGTRLATLQGKASTGRPVWLFSSPTDITFRFLKFLHSFVVDVEVSKNRYWEWEEAIVQGHSIFHSLRCEGQGTVTVDLAERSIKYSPEACINLNGKVAGLGSAHLQPNEKARGEQLRNLAQKHAILDALGFSDPTEKDLQEITITEVASRGISVKTSGAAREAAWRRKVVTYQTSVRTSASGTIYCTALALADN
jgi:NTP pyrophosphatase (non-canonical NTP hydrolase)